MVEPLWRGLVGYRLLALAYAVAMGVANYDAYLAPTTAVVVLALMAGWTAFTTVAYLRPGRRLLAVLDLLVTLAAIAATLLVESPERIAAGAPILPTVWSAGSAIACALAFGPVSGLAAALVMQGAVLLVRGRVGSPELTDLLLTVSATLALGYAAVMLRRSAEQLSRATALRAAVAERERLARSIHDGVLQVLARVRRRGSELGGPAAELAELAGEQEVALRTLMSTGPPDQQPAGQVDLATLIAGLSTPHVTTSMPATAVLVPAHTAHEVVAAVKAALHNVEVHVGAGEPAWVFVEDLGERVVVSVRDDGPGMAPDRLAAAEAEGRLGVRQSIKGRIEAVGGTARCESEVGMGCEWVFEVPVDAR
ncbi:MacS family sensor histidine kinase [Pseudonocardia spinosispora]|uniref:MacS family sensor histidine kinase n=1 Tax=Pseudonocardia spinosispora TaxID=103441 RepID=UPI00042220AF|nr:DUF5931 domain-containing protein [Pseudonocardia spinosispora]